MARRIKARTFGNVRPGDLLISGTDILVLCIWNHVSDVATDVRWIGYIWNGKLVDAYRNASTRINVVNT